MIKGLSDNQSRPDSDFRGKDNWSRQVSGSYLNGIEDAINEGGLGGYYDSQEDTGDRWWRLYNLRRNSPHTEAPYPAFNLDDYSQ